MEPEAEDPDNNDNLVTWSGSDGSQELCVSESLAESYYEDDASDAEYPLDPQPAHIPQPDLKSPERRQSQDWESAGEQQSMPELSGSEEDVSYQEEEDIYLSESRESIRESPHIQPSPTSPSPHPQRPDSEPQAGQISRPHSQSSSSSLGCAADMTLALTLTTEQPLGSSNRQGLGTGNRRVESSEEGGSSEAPPASVFFGISGEGAEQAEKWNSESDTDLCRPDRHRTRHTRKFLPSALTCFCGRMNQRGVNVFFKIQSMHDFFLDRTLFVCFKCSLRHKLTHDNNIKLHFLPVIIRGVT